MSRAELSRILSISRMTTSTIVGDLIAEGLLVGIDIGTTTNRNRNVESILDQVESLVRSLMESASVPPAPFIVTLSMMAIARGVATVLTSGYYLSGLPDAYRRRTDRRS